MFTAPLKTMNNCEIVVGQTVEGCSLQISQPEDVHPILKAPGCLNRWVGSRLPSIRVRVTMSRILILRVQFLVSSSSSWNLSCRQTSPISARSCLTNCRMVSSALFCWRLFAGPSLQHLPSFSDHHSRPLWRIRRQGIVSRETEEPKRLQNALHPNLQAICHCVCETEQIQTTRAQE